MRCSKGMTLIEVLTVVGVIVILLALLSPSFEKAIATSEKAHCLSNLHAVGTALGLYLNDSPGMRYPRVELLWTLLGNMGEVYFDPKYGAVDARPLNRYLGYQGSGNPFDGQKVPVAECPSDTGDPYSDTDNTYRAYGSSYFAAIFSYSGIEGAFLPQMKASRVIRPATKWLVFDSVSYTDCDVVNDYRVRWHTNEPERRVNILYADSHAENFLVDYFHETDTHGYPVGQKPDPHAKWW